MQSTAPTIQMEIQRYLRTGDADLMARAWPDDELLQRTTRAHRELRAALVAEVRRRTAGRNQPRNVTEGEIRSLITTKVGPMVLGLFAHEERAPVLSAIANGVMFLTPDNLERALHRSRWATTAWSLANVYLGHIGAELLAQDTPSILGLSDGADCYVSMAYFDEPDPFADFLVHEVAHLFHNCRRVEIGLLETKLRKYPLNINFREHETFAYCCEFYSRILGHATTRDQGAELVETLAQRLSPNDLRFNTQQVVDILRRAAVSKNGWQTILRWCAGG